jgi:ATP phosphoribosyltransferase
MPISSRLIINQAALKLKRQAIQPMLEAFSAAITLPTPLSPYPLGAAT